jgi:hypothetical protein
MARDVFAIGETVRARATYTDPDTGALTDPSSVSATLREPDGTLTTFVYNVDPELTKVSTGVYQLSIPLALVGTYKWKWVGTATEKSAVDFDECDSEKEAGF